LGHRALEDGRREIGSVRHKYLQRRNHSERRHTVGKWLSRRWQRGDRQQFWDSARRNGHHQWLGLDRVKRRDTSRRRWIYWPDVNAERRRYHEHRISHSAGAWTFAHAF